MKSLILARQWLLADFHNGTASKVIRSFNELTSQDRVFLILRVSGRERLRNLPDQHGNLRDAVSAIGAHIVGLTKVQISGFDPFWLRQSAREAREAGATVLLAESTDRFVRNPLFHSQDRKRKEYQASDVQLKEVVECTGGMKLMTHLNPDASPSVVRSYQRKRGQKYKDARGGRPKNRTAGHKRKIRWANLVEVRRARRSGMSIRQIAQEFRIPKSTINEWLNR